MNFYLFHILRLYTVFEPLFPHSSLLHHVSPKGDQMFFYSKKTSYRHVYVIPEYCLCAQTSLKIRTHLLFCVSTHFALETIYYLQDLGGQVQPTS